jgi:hypothetical protein
MTLTPGSIFLHTSHSTSSPQLHDLEFISTALFLADFSVGRPDTHTLARTAGTYTVTYRRNVNGRSSRCSITAGKAPLGYRSGPQRACQRGGTPVGLRLPTAVGKPQNPRHGRLHRNAAAYRHEQRVYAVLGPHHARNRRAGVDQGLEPTGRTSTWQSASRRATTSATSCRQRPIEWGRVALWGTSRRPRPADGKAAHGIQFSRRLENWPGHNSAATTLDHPCPTANREPALAGCFFLS